MKAWFESHPLAQMPEGVRGLLAGWEMKDRSGAIAYAIANAERPSFEKGVNELAYTLLRHTPDEATSLILRLPPKQGQTVVQEIAKTTTSIILHVPEDYQKPSDE